MFHLILLPVVILFVLFAILFRVLSWPFRYRRRFGRGWYGRRWGWDGYRNPYAPGLLTVLGIVLLERLFGRRYY